MITQILAKVLPVLVMIALGRVCATKGILNDDQHAGLKNIIGDILLPLMTPATNTASKLLAAPMAAFTIASLGLMGIPPLAGFVSKWGIATAAVETGMPLAYAGVAALIVSALLTALYLMAVVLRAYFPAKGFDPASVKEVEDPNRLMTVPLLVLSAASVLLGLCASPLIAVFEQIAAGLL